MNMSSVTSFLYRILPGHMLYYVSIGAAVIAAAVGIWYWARKKKAG